MKKPLLILLGMIILIPVIFIALVNLYLLEPAYYAAKANCYEEVQKGMTYDEVDGKVGNLFEDGPYGINERGDGQVYLKNEIKFTDGSCRIQFKDTKVISNDLLFVFF